VARRLRLGDSPALLYRAKRGTGRALVLAPGAGAPQTHPFLVGFAGGLAARGIDVLTFDFAYMAKGSRRPDSSEVLEACWLSVLGFARKKLAGPALFIGGKSMGGRIASQIAAREESGELAGLVFLGYPLHPPGDPKKLRVAHLPRVRAPMLFVQGERDPFGTPREIARFTKGLRAELVVVPDGDHSFAVRKSAGVDQRRALEDAMDAVDRFMAQIQPGGGRSTSARR
jgi:predicted alpha/beta-hydrolase family hydrolase